jgi:sugar fermentation stimulation protein A
MRFDPPLIEATLIERSNRFVAQIQIGKREYRAHVHDPGRMKELLYPGVRVLVQRAPAGRKTSHDVMLARKGRAWVSVYSTLPNKLVKEAFRDGLLPEFGSAGHPRSEVTCGDSRFDFLLPTNPETWLEVKSVTLVKGRTALFPDAPTKRGQRHVDHLAHLADRGEGAALFFVVQRSDVDVVKMNEAQDPKFAEAVRRAAKSGVCIRARKCRVSARAIRITDPVPVDLS